MCSQHHRRICPTSSRHGDGRGFTPVQQLPPRPRDVNITQGKESACTSPTNTPAQRTTSTGGESSLIHGAKNGRWQAFCLHMRRINPHSGCHLYSLIGLWCPLNQSVKGWPDGAQHTHHSEGGEVYTPHHRLSRHCSTEIQTRVGWGGRGGNVRGLF